MHNERIYNVENHTMKPLKRTAILGVSLLMSLVLAPIANAQDEPAYGIVGDVDGDGIVGPTDVQHVINGALGLRDRGPDAVRHLVRQYIVASPRAALAPVPQLQTGDNEVADRCTVAGAAYNFPRDDGRMLVRTGSVVVFRFDRNAEAVIYPGACGLIRSQLLLELRELDATTETDAPEVEPEWMPIGRDAIEGRRCGPIFGTGHVAVRHLFERPGSYLVRATVSTYAVPEQDSDDPEAALCGAARSVDEVLIGVRVGGPDADPGDLDWEDDGRAHEVHELFGDILERRMDTEERLP
jgi:hypothetical protein